MRKDWLIRSFRAECKGFFVFLNRLNLENLYKSLSIARLAMPLTIKTETLNIMFIFSAIFGETLLIF